MQAGSPSVDIGNDDRQRIEIQDWSPAGHRWRA